MSDIDITNVHVHSFTRRHIPRDYPNWLLARLQHVTPLIRLIAWSARRLGAQEFAERVDRLIRFKREADSARQEQIIERVMRQYPGSTRFVVLPMDMEPMGYGPVAESIEDQHDDLARIAGEDKFNGRIIPFATIHAGRPDAAAEVSRCINDLGFKGLKLYPRMGFSPTESVLMQDIYPLLQSKGLPVMTHCSRGGVIGRTVTPARGDRYTEPDAYVDVLDGFPELRICLAHFGGMRDWRDYIEHGYDPDDPEARRRNWQMRIRQMIGSGNYPNLWTDISYTLFHFEDYAPFLRLFLMGDDPASERLRRRVLFGSDYYMTRQEELSERAVCVRLRNVLGEEVFRQIADTNPKVWLGEQTEPPMP